MSSWFHDDSHDKSFLVYEEDNENAVFDTVLIGMVTNNNIDGIVPFVFSQQDSTRYVKYDITDRITLASFLSKMISKKEFVSLLTSICDAIIDIKDYMLEEKAICLGTDVVYYDFKTGKASFILNPTIAPFPVPNYNSFFRDVLGVSTFNQNDDNSYVAEIISFINKKQSFPVYELKKMLFSLEEQSDEYVQDISANFNTGFNGNFIPNSNLTGSNTSFPTTANNISEKEEFASESRKKGILNKIKPNKKIDEKSTSNNTYSNIEVPGQLDMGVVSSSGIAIPCNMQDGIDSQPIIMEKNAKEHHTNILGKGKLFNRKQKNQNTTNIPATSQQIATQSAVPNGFVSQGNMTISKPCMVAQQNSMQSSSLDMNKIRTNTDITDDDDLSTIVLSAVVSEKSATAIKRLSTSEMVYITKDKFVIGKERDITDFTIFGNTAISRSHAVIKKLQNDYYITDDNSKNHTYVNGRLISGSEEYLLNNNDVIKLANEEFVFTL